MKFFESNAFGILMIVFGGLSWITATESYSYLFVLLGFVVGGIVLYRNYKNKKFTSSRLICNNCGYVALDQRELHNHSITCKTTN